MKVSVEIDCTPQEARAFFGLPDIEPLQEQLVARLQEQLDRNLSAIDPENLLKNWAPNALQGLEGLRKMFGSAMASAYGATASSGAKSSSPRGVKKKPSKRRTPS